jgi:hypothetical protein
MKAYAADRCFYCEVKPADLRETKVLFTAA